MYMVGALSCADGTNCVIHKIDCAGFFRIDFLEPDGEFNLDTNKILYSRYRDGNKTREYGDVSLYRMYDDIYNAKYAQQTDPPVNRWENGKFIQETVSKNREQDYVVTTTKVNGRLYSTSILAKGDVLQFEVVDPDYKVKLKPNNSSDYREVTITKSTESNEPYYPLDIIMQRHNIHHIFKEDFVLVQDVESARERLSNWKKKKVKYKGIDTETSGLDIWKFGEDKMVGIILAEDEHTSTYYPFRHTHKDLTNLPMSFLEELMEVIMSESDVLVAWNKKFDRQVFMLEGYDLHIKHDGMILDIILNNKVKFASHSLKERIYALFALKYLELSDIFINKKSIDFSILPPEIVRIYACPDATDVIRYMNSEFPKLPTFQHNLYKIECDLADLKADQEFYGLRVDVQKYARNHDNCNYIIDILEKAFRKLTRIDGNINSSEVISNLLYNTLKCEVLKRTVKGNRPSTSSSTIEKLSKKKSNKDWGITEDLVDKHGKIIVKAKDLNKSKYPALVILAKYRKYIKLKTAFYSRFEKTMKVGRISFWINQNGAESGRQSSPMHQLPPELKEVILSDHDKSLFGGADYSQIELRVLAYLANEPDLCELCNDPNNDIHRVIGSLISGKEMWEITAEERSRGKRRNFGVVYLISAYGLAEQMVGPGPSDEVVAQAKESIDEFYNRFKHITLFLTYNKKFVQEHGYMKTALLNRYRWFLDIFNPDISKSRKASLIRQSNNLPVQGYAADMLKISEVNMYKYIYNKGWNRIVDGYPMVRVMLSAHDEVLVSKHEDVPNEEFFEMIRECMELDVEGAPAFFTAPAIMHDWEGHNDDSLPVPVELRDKLIEDYHRTGVSAFKYSKYSISTTEKLTLPNNISIKDFVKENIDKFIFTYISGDYTTEISEEGAYEGAIHFIESGERVCRDTNYKVILHDYHESRLKDYMNNLISEYGTDYRITGQKVRHPSLTHELIARYADVLRANDIDDHVDKIMYATKYYIEGLEGEEIVKEREEIVRASTEDFVDQLEPMVDVDKDGNYVYYEDADDRQEEYEMNSDYYIPSGKVYKAWELFDKVILDLSKLSVESANYVIADIFSKRVDDGFYDVNIMAMGQIRSAGFRIDTFDQEYYSDLIERLEGGKYNAI